MQGTWEIERELQNLTESFHDLDKRIELVEKHDGYLLNSMKGQIKEMTEDLAKIKDIISKREGYRHAISFILSLVSVLTASGVQDYFFKLLGIEV